LGARGGDEVGRADCLDDFWWLADGTKMEMEVFFLSMDRPEEIGKLKGIELTGVWLNEAGRAT
jgi:hypothetical protein